MSIEDDIRARLPLPIVPASEAATLLPIVPASEAATLLPIVPASEAATPLPIVPAPEAATPLPIVPVSEAATLLPIVPASGATAAQSPDQVRLCADHASMLAAIMASPFPTPAKGLLVKITTRFFMRALIRNSLRGFQ